MNCPHDVDERACPRCRANRLAAMPRLRILEIRCVTCGGGLIGRASANIPEVTPTADELRGLSHAHPEHELAFVVVLPSVRRVSS